MANKKISELTAKTTPELTDSTVIVDGTGTKKTTLSAIRALTQKISDLSAQVTPSLSNETVIDDSGTLKRTTLSAIKDLIAPATTPVVEDGLTTFGGNQYLLRKTWKNSTTPIGSLINLSTDGVSGVNSGAIIYAQNNGTGRRCYLVNEGRNGGKCLRFQLTPNGSKNPVTGATEDISTQAQYWNSGFAISPGSNVYDVVEGDELWCRVWMYFSSNYSFAPVTGSVPKYIRIYPFRWDTAEVVLQVDASGANYHNTPGAAMGFLQNWSGGNTNCYPEQYSGVARYLPLGRWFCVENYLKISSTAGTAKWIMWVDGLKAWDIVGTTTTPNFQTLTPANTNTTLMNMPRVVLNSTFDGTASAGATLPNGAQYSMYDSVLLTNSRSFVEANGTTDASGNVMIGPNY